MSAETEALAASVAEGVELALVYAKILHAIAADCELHGGISAARFAEIVKGQFAEAQRDLSHLQAIGGAMHESRQAGKAN